MAAPRAALLSSDELKAYLLHSLQGRGVLDSLKSQLRNKLATELQKAVECAEPGKVRAEPAKPTMPVYFANSIVARHLKQMGYEYSLSIFLPEAEVNIDKLPTHADLLHFVRASPSSRLYATLEQNNEQGFLVQLLEALPMVLAAPATHCAAIQTDQQLKKDSSIYDKLQALEEAYAQRTEEELSKCQKSLEERIQGAQLECEQQYKRQLQTELAHFKERELSEMRLEEKNRSHQELTRLRAELESAYRQRNDSVRKMELEMMERMKHKEQDLERGIHAQRQGLLEELEGLKGKKVELDRMRAELEKKEELGRLQEEHVRKMAEQLESHKCALQALQQQCDKMAEEKARRYQIEYERNHQARNDDLSRRESELKEYDHVVHKVAELQGLLHTASTHQVGLQQEKEVLVHKLSETAGLHQRLTEAEGQLSDMRKKETGYSHTIKELQNKLVAQQKQLDKMTRLHAKELQGVDLENQNLRNQLDTQCQYNLELQKGLDDQTLHLRTAQRELKDLQEQVEHLQAALKATYRPGQPSVKKHVKARSPDPHHTSRSSAKSSSHRHVFKRDGEDEVWKGQGRHDTELTDAFLAESKSTFARLEKEAQQLEQSFQHLGLCQDAADPCNGSPPRTVPHLRAQFQTSPLHRPLSHFPSGHLLKTPEYVRNTAATMATSPSPSISATPYPSVTPHVQPDAVTKPSHLLNSFPLMLADHTPLTVGTAHNGHAPLTGDTAHSGHTPPGVDIAYTGHTPLAVDTLHHHSVTHPFVPQPSVINRQPLLDRLTTPTLITHVITSQQQPPPVPSSLPHTQQQAPPMSSLPHTQQQAPPVPSSLPHTQQQAPPVPSSLPHTQQQAPPVPSSLPHTQQQAPSMPSSLPHTQQAPPMSSSLPHTQQQALVDAHLQTITTLPSQVTSHVTTLPSQVTSHVTTLPSQVTSHVTTLPSHVTTLPSHVTTLPSQVTSHVTTLPSQVTSHVTPQVTIPSGLPPISSSQQQLFPPTPAVPTFNLDSLWKDATPLAPPPTQVVPGPRPNRKTFPDVMVEDIEEKYHNHTGTDQKVIGSTGMELRHTNGTESEQLNINIAGAEQKRISSTGTGHNNTSISGIEWKHMNISGMEQKRTNISGMEQKHASTSGMEQKHTSTSGMEQKHTSTSGMEQKHTSSSDLESSWEAARLRRLRQQEEREREERERVERELQSLEHTVNKEDPQEASLEQEGWGPEGEGHGALEEGQQGDEGHGKQSGEEDIDPVMLKYMELVQKQREQKTQPQTFHLAEPLQSPLQEGEVTPSQASDANGAADHSEHEDAFQDW